MRISPILLSKFKSTKAPVTNDRYAFMSNSKINTLSSDTFQKSPILRSNDISFGYEFALKKPKGLSCAYCGKPVLSQDEIYEFSELNIVGDNNILMLCHRFCVIKHFVHLLPPCAIFQIQLLICHKIYSDH